MIADLLTAVAAVLIGLFLWNVWPPATALVAALVMLVVGFALADGRGWSGRRR